MTKADDGADSCTVVAGHLEKRLQMMVRLLMCGKVESLSLQNVLFCHIDVTSGHMGLKKALARITERFAWKGMTEDVKSI